MAEKQTAVAPGMTDMATLIAALSSSIQSIAPKPELKEGDPEYVERQRAEGWFDDFFGKKIFQNAYEAQPRGESEEVRKRASQLKAGVYMVGKNKARKVEVFVNGNDITIAYPIKGDAGLINQQHWASFGDLVNQLWDAMHEPVPA